MEQHIDNIRTVMPALVVALNRFPTDTPSRLAHKNYCREPVLTWRYQKS